jgi:hypothetical protein
MVQKLLAKDIDIRYLIDNFGLQLIRPLAKKICVIFKGWLKFRSNFELLG